jgi:phosphopantothenate---cysteine ligase (CTP)|uniref:phosphopantothenoylcysteine decarboxylase n=1 Tax=Cephaloticoccus sp. TaxID=1985742 RepID=UPI00404972E1
MKLLVTAGATREPIDSVRYLSNVSTGRTGASLATTLAERGYDVTLLHGQGAAMPSALVATREFGSAGNLGAQLRVLLGTGDYDAVIMAAAVADYRPAEVATGKISSAADQLTLSLIRNPKLLTQLRGFSPRPLIVIGFKLTVGAGETQRAAAVAAQFSVGGIDAVVHNDLAEIRATTAHPFRLYTSAQQPPRELAGEAALAAELDGLITEGKR